MKKQILLITLLMALLAPVAMKGQQSLTVYDGTNTNGYIPMYTYYCDYGFKSEYIIPASSLQEKGLVNGDVLKSIQLYQTSSATWVAKDLTIKLSNTATSSYSSTDLLGSSGTTVYTNSSYSANSASSHTFTFTTPFTYTGGSLIVQISALSGGTYNSSTWYGTTTTTNQGYYVYGSSSSSGSLQTFVPKTTFTYTTPSCPMPTLGDAQYITAQGASFQWTENGTATSWVLQYSTASDFTGATSVNRSIPSYAITGLNGGTTYYVRVKSSCGGGDESDWSNVVSFTTEVACPAPTDLVVSNITARGANLSWNGSSYSYIVEIADPSAATPSSTTEEVFSEGFAVNSMPTGWTNEGKWQIGTGDNNSSSAHSGGYNAQTSSSSGSGASSYLITPAIDLSAYANAKLTCWYINHSWGGDTDAFGVYYRTSNTGAWTELFSTTSAHSSWTQTNELSLPSEAFVQIGFKYTDNYGYGVGLDDVVINANPLQLAWNTVSNNVSTTSYTLSGLNPETAYLVRVTGDCGVDGLSLPSEVVSFTTESACPAPTALNATNVLLTSATLSWEGEAESYEMEYANLGTSGANVSTFDFEGGTLQGWTNLIVEADGGQWLHSNNNPAGYDYTGRAHGGTGFALSFSFVDNPDAKFDPGRYNTNVYLVSPQSYQINEGASLTFWYNYANSSYADNMEVCVATAANPTASDFTSIWSSSAVSDWTQVNIPLNAYNGQTIWVAFHHEDYDMYEVWVDDITIDAGTSVTWIPVNGTVTSPYTLNGLTSDTEYAVHVRANCGADGTSAWSTSATFTTASACATPTEMNTTNITAASATLNWTGVQENYNVRYGKVFYEGFENGIPSTWTTIDSDGDGHNWLALSDIPTTYSYYSGLNMSGWAHAGNNAATSASYVNSVGTLNANNWLITPQVDLGGTLEFYVASTYDGDLDSYEVLLSTDGTEITNFTITLKDMTTAPYGSWDLVSINLNAYEGQQGYIAIHHVSSSKYFLVVDDFGIYYDMQTITATESPITINQLDPNSYYAWQVQGINCDGNGGTTDWSALATFTTPEGYTKDIDAYTTNGGYYLIASPLASPVTPANVTNMISNTYDLYRFNQRNQTEWENYKGHTSGFVLENGKGYLYANSEDVQLVFSGSAYTGTGEIALTQDASNELRGNWNLVGNPYPETATVNVSSFYVMNGDGSDVIGNTSNTVAAMEGIFVLYDSENNITSVTFTPGTGSKSNEQLTLNITQGRSNVIDRAIVRFDGNSQLPKFQLFETSTKLYIPQGTNDFAVVNAEAQGEMPVNFEATSNGTYTLSFNAENVEFSYLHLIDNMTGAEVDLLETPSYSFNATTSDYASRFKLVFAQGNNSNSNEFAFISDGNIIVNGEGLLQVIDMTGRVISTSQVSGMSNIKLNAAAGVYVLKLNDKTQKIVLK